MHTIIQCGLGSMGSLMAEIAMEKKDIWLVGAVERNKELHGTLLSKYLKKPMENSAKIHASVSEAVKETNADTAIIATGSFLKDEISLIEEAVNSGLNVISIAEEMAYPKAVDKAIAENLDKLAKKNSVTVLGTGINPGFVLDFLIVTLSGISRRIEKIYSERVNDLSPYGDTVMRTQGISLSPEEFEKGIKNGSVVGHIGFPQSVMMISDGLNLDLDEIKEVKTPIIAKKRRVGKHITVEPGMVAGCNHVVFGYKNGKKIIELVHPQQIEPAAEGLNTWDYIKITGTPEINLRIEPEIAGGTGTAAIAVNMVPIVKNAAPGLKSMIDLPVPRLSQLAHEIKEG